MALAYLLDPCLQFQNRAGVNNVSGWCEVFRMDTDDRAEVYYDFTGTLAPAKIVIDNNGRAPMIVEDGIPYRLEVYLPSGELLYTQQPLYPGAGGGAGNIVDVISSDGSIGVDRSVSGSNVTFDLTTHVEDDPELLGYIECSGATIEDGFYKPTVVEGTMEVGTYGVLLTGGQYYHVTSHIRATKTGISPNYDQVSIDFYLHTTPLTSVCSKKEIVDYSMGLSQEFEVSFDVAVENDAELVLKINGQDVNAGAFELVDLDIHRVYSGAPYIPSGVLSKAEAAETYQEKLVAGDNITIENNVISSTGGSGETYTAGNAISITDGLRHDKVINVKLKTNGGLKFYNATLTPDWNSIEVKTDDYTTYIDPNNGALKVAMPVSPYGEPGQILTLNNSYETEWKTLVLPEGATVIEFSTDPTAPMSEALDGVLEKLIAGTASLPVYMKLPAFDGSQLQAGARFLQLVEWEYASPWFNAEMKFSAANRFYDNTAQTMRYGFEQVEVQRYGQGTQQSFEGWYAQRHEFLAFTPTVVTL